MAPMCPPIRAHWRHMANTIELVRPLAHPNPQSKRQIDRFSRFCTAHGRKSLYSTMGVPFPKIAPSYGRIWTASNTRFLGPIRAHNTNGISICSDVFAQMTAECPYTSQWDIPSPSILPLPMGIWTPSNIWFP